MAELGADATLALGIGMVAGSIDRNPDVIGAVLLDLTPENRGRAWRAANAILSGLEAIAAGEAAAIAGQGDLLGPFGSEETDGGYRA